METPMLTVPEQIAFILLVLTSAFLSWKSFSVMIKVMTAVRVNCF